MIHENIELTGSFTVSGSFVLPSHASSSAVYETGSMYHDTVEGVLKVYTGTQWVTVGEQTGPGPDYSQDIEYLLVAGGGGGGYGSGGGGGGAGGLLSSSLASVTSGSSFTITVGGGGAGAVDSTSTNPVDGVSSTIAGASITTITTIGGGGGANESGTVGQGGGSGGGGSYNRSPGAGTNGQGYTGGSGHTNNPHYTGGGGGGAGEAGGTGNNSNGGLGGDGLQSKITGTSTYYAGGGTGDIQDTSDVSDQSSPGGQGGGGSGGNYRSSTSATAAGNGTSNTGGGGGGGTNQGSFGNGVGGSGGSGLAIFAYDSGSKGAGGGFTGDAGNGRKYHQFNISDTFVVGSVSDFQITTDSLYAHYDAGHLDSRGTSTWTDLKGSNNGTVTNSATLDDYHYTLNGSNQYIQISAELVTSDDMSIEVWLTIDNPSESGTYREIISQQANSNRGIYFGKTSTANQLRFGGSTYNFSSINASTFTHLVVTRNSSGDVIFYENGSQGGTATGHGFSTSQAIYNGTGTRIGRQYGNYTEYWDGNIAQVRFYNKILSAAEVLQNYNATKTNFI